MCNFKYQRSVHELNKLQSGRRHCCNV